MTKSVFENRRKRMSLEAHIETLEKRHGALEDQLHTARQHSSSCDFAIADIKKNKLRIKDEIERLRSSTTH